MSVRDEGGGLDPAILDKIFEPFFTTKSVSHQGTGLGLSTAYGIVESHGGRIWAENNPAGGARIALVVPRSTKKLASLPPADKLARPVPEGAAERILLIEDNPELRQSTAAILEALGYRVGIAEHGRQALAMFEDHWGDVAMVITDVVMPGMSGKEISDRLRAQRPDLGVLFVSGYTGDVMSHHGFDSDQEAFLEKPFSAVQLAAKVAAVLRRRGA